ncbi:MAG: DNRLRE domain-containing protein [Alphaproteobacteria bacterium]|nr:DNRLRE domain-containing protein [Alphaproteobacteria bacterium]
MRQRSIAGAFALTTLLATAAQAGPLVTLQPGEAASEDVFVYEFAVPGAFGIATAARATNLDSATLGALTPLPAVPFGNFLGSSNTTPLIGAGGETRAHDTRTLIRFDLAGLALASGSIAKATLGLFAVPGLPPFDDPTAARPVTTELREVTSAWGETTVTWETQPSVSDVVGTFVQTGVNQFVTFDVTGLVKDWLDDPSGNLGVRLSQPDILASDAGRPIASLYLSSTAADPSLRPFLAIETVPEPATSALLGAGVGMIAWKTRRRRTA